MYLKRIILVASVIGVVILGIFSYFVYNAVLSPNTNFQEKEVTIYIPTGSDFNEVIHKISPYLSDIETFKRVATQKKYAHNVKAGKYIIKRGSNNNDIVNILRSKNVPIKLTFNNQDRLQDLAGRISQQIEADSLSLLESFLETSFLSENQFSDKDAITMYLPNTYEFFWNTSADQFRDRMLKEYNRFWTEEKKLKAENQNLSPKQVSVLASIVQKETAQVSERSRVAGVYLNRLKSNMLLQADPTVIFAIKEHSGNYDTIIRRVLNRDLEIDSPYNTYKYAGLPPAPIAMPDVSSIEAVLNPEKHDFFYFVADIEKPGFHKFARTYNQHLINSKAYHQWINSQGVRR
ncbi:endolytic transglycosylase MltG [Capnocytophaga cynodegmi]|uniref:endolytic transglycosylase MltG n=1 Tax=Capnocytophaga cynodegmi TaxID=28189 RepID=UPI001ACC37A9|nr:endolytic transglycosylase MltG [Capnocytophaga cynodegmi]GIM53929.1 aminodeoxychorismate lyase [Capnocytophaga cynodegmi]